MNRLIVLIITIAVAFGRTTAAADVPTLDLSTVIQQALQQNPALRAARARAEAAAAMPAQVSALDDPTFAYEAYNAPGAFRVDRADNNILRVSQRIPFPGKRRLAGEAAERDADSVRREVEVAELDLAAAVTVAFYDLWLAHEKVLLFGREKTLAQRFARTAEQRYATAGVTQSDVLRAQLELTRLVNRVATARLEVETAAAELNALLGNPPDAPLAMPQLEEVPEIVEPLDHWVELALRRRPEVAGQQALVGRDESRVALAERQYYPDFEFTVGRFINPNAEDGFGAIASVSIPLLHRAKYKAGIDEAKARLSATHAEGRTLQDRIRREVKQALVRLQTARLQRDLFVSTHIPQTEQALRVTESAYQAGTVDFLALTETARAIEEVHIEHLDAESDLAKAYAELERAIGTPVAGREMPGESRP